MPQVPQSEKVNVQVEEQNPEDFLANQELINLMENDQDERFRSSDLLKFLKKV